MTLYNICILQPHKTKKFMLLLNEYKYKIISMYLKELFPKLNISLILKYLLVGCCVPFAFLVNKVFSYLCSSMDKIFFSVLLVAISCLVIVRLFDYNLLIYVYFDYQSANYVLLVSKPNQSY